MEFCDFFFNFPAQKQLKRGKVFFFDCSLKTYGRQDSIYLWNVECFHLSHVFDQIKMCSFFSFVLAFTLVDVIG